MPSRFHRSLFAAADNSEAAAAERRRHQVIGEQANREMMERFAPLSADNVKDALDWQAARIAELESSSKPGTANA